MRHSIAPSECLDPLEQLFVDSILCLPKNPVSSLEFAVSQVWAVGLHDGFLQVSSRDLIVLTSSEECRLDQLDVLGRDAYVTYQNELQVGNKSGNMPLLSSASMPKVWIL